MTQVLKKALAMLTGSEGTAEFSVPKKIRPLKKLTERELLQLESEIGRELFGAVPAGTRREFFNLDPTTWIWYEESKDEAGRVHATTTRYEVQEKGILKAQDGAHYSYLEGDELRNLTLAVQVYYERVMREVYGRDPHTGQKLERP